MSTSVYSPSIPELFWKIYDRWIAPGVVPALEQDLHQSLIPSISAGSHILDVGSGGGQHATRIAIDRPDLKVTGIDIEPVMVKRSRRLAERVGVSERVVFIQGTALDLPFEDLSFDHVICAGPIKQERDKKRVLTECLRVLRPGGRLLVMDVDRGCRLKDVQAMVDRTPLRGPFKSMLRFYFIRFVASASVDIQEVRELWEPLELLDCDGPRRISGFPAFIAIGTKS